MHDTKIAIGRNGKNLPLETSSAITDDALKDIVGGYEWYPTFDEKNKVIRIVPGDINDFDNPFFRIRVRDIYSAKINQGFEIIFTTESSNNWSPQAK